jgi:Mg-chelatase subunit ChlI
MAIDMTGATKPGVIGIALAAEEVVELKMIVQDEDATAALEFVHRLRRKVAELEKKHCGAPDRLPGS